MAPARAADMAREQGQVCLQRAPSHRKDFAEVGSSVDLVPGDPGIKLTSLKSL